MDDCACFDTGALAYSHAVRTYNDCLSADFRACLDLDVGVLNGSPMPYVARDDDSIFQDYSGSKVCERQCNPPADPRPRHLPQVQPPADRVNCHGIGNVPATALRLAMTITKMNVAAPNDRRASRHRFYHQRSRSDLCIVADGQVSLSEYDRTDADLHSIADSDLRPRLRSLRGQDPAGGIEAAMISDDGVRADCDRRSPVGEARIAADDD